MILASIMLLLFISAMILIPEWGKLKCARILHTCDGVPYAESSHRGYVDIVCRMERLHTQKDSDLTDYEKLDCYRIGDICRAGSASIGVKSFIRMCHMAGIEIVIRPVNGEVKDLEADSEEKRRRLYKLRRKYRRAHGLKT
ncbi:MAG: hypothetical protein ACI36Z_01380 [Alloprevotella sp.]